MAVLAEAVLVLTVLVLGRIGSEDTPKPVRIVNMAIEATSEPASDQPSPTGKPAPTRSTPRAVQAAAPQTSPAPAALPVEASRPPVIIPVPRDQMAAFDISRVPSQPRPASPGKAMMGPVDSGVSGDSKRVGSAPNGQPMYAASWYREPYEEELRGYLSSASGPGWALIACRTVADYRVDDCVGLDEYPGGSQILRAVLAAAWQFRVRPPRVGGVTQVGDWVRIRIDYTERRP